MDDPVYAEKYEEGAERGDLLGKVKQALDARHTEGLTGFYFGGGAQVRPDSGNAMGGASIGVEGYATNWPIKIGWSGDVIPYSSPTRYIISLTVSHASYLCFRITQPP